MSVLLEIRNLKKYFHVPDGWLHAVDDVSFTLEAGKTLGIVGESAAANPHWAVPLYAFLTPQKEKYALTERESQTPEERN